jgi:hypothetical protein
MRLICSVPVVPGIEDLIKRFFSNMDSAVVDSFLFGIMFNEPRALLNHLFLLKFAQQMMCLSDNLLEQPDRLSFLTGLNLVNMLSL